MFLYFILLIDLAVFSNAVTAYVLVCGRMLSELGLFIFLTSGVLLMFSSSLSCLHQPIKMFHGIDTGMLALFEMFMSMFSAHEYEAFHEEEIVLVAVFAYLVVVVIFLGNMLIAQLSCAYGTIYNDMVGYARLKRIGIITESMPAVPEKRWKKFVKDLSFETKIEFNEGDIGLAGGIASSEPASAHPTTVDVIKRFGGSTAPSLQWPEEEGAENDDSDKFGRLEKLLQQAFARVNAETKGRRRGKVVASSNGMSGNGASSAEGAGAEEGDAEEVAEQLILRMFSCFAAST